LENRNPFVKARQPATPGFSSLSSSENTLSPHQPRLGHDASGFQLFVGHIMKQRLVAIVTGKEGLAYEKLD
jgi:hypothetical protein